MENIWVEKYRPKTLDDLILPDEYREKFEEYIEKKEIPHLLLVGERGTGKTSVAKILIENIIKDKSELLKINGSLDNSIDILREKVITFLKIPPFKSNIKIVHYEEFDYVSRAVQPALRDPMEEYMKNGRFIFTCNYFDNIIEPIKSRCQIFQFRKLPIDKIKERLIFILNNENIDFNEKDLDFIIKKFYPSLRDMIQYINMASLNGKLNIIDLKTNEEIIDVMAKIVDMLNTKDFKTFITYLREIDKKLKTQFVDYNELFNKLYETEALPFAVRAYMSALILDFKNGSINHMNFIGVLFKVWTFASKL